MCGSVPSLLISGPGSASKANPELWRPKMEPLRLFLEPREGSKWSQGGSSWSRREAHNGAMEALPGAGGRLTMEPLEALPGAGGRLTMELWRLFLEPGEGSQWSH